MSAQVMKDPTLSSNRRKNQIKLIAIFAVAGVPVILAMLMYFGGFAVPSQKTNKGELLMPPLPLSSFGFEQNGQGFYEASQGKWLIIQTGAGSCDERCVDMAHAARQVNVLMAREQSRVARILVAPGSDAVASVLSEDYPNLGIYEASAEAVEALSSADVKLESGTRAWQLWISDPLGNVILRYDETNSGYDLRDDLKKLLKLSNIG